MSNTEQNVKIVIDDKMYFITEEVNSSDFNEISQVVHEEVDEGGQDDDLGFWSQHDNALRDLLVFLVQKHCIEDMMDSKMKSQCWVSLSYWMNLDKQYRGKYFYLFGDNHHGTDLKFDWIFGKILPFEG